MNTCDKAPLSLPAPDPEAGTSAHQLDVGAESKMTFDALGPLVVNSDGTLSRVANWPHMTELERERTMRVLLARNKIRLTDQQNKLNEQASAEPV